MHCRSERCLEVEVSARRDCGVWVALSSNHYSNSNLTTLSCNSSYPDEITWVHFVQIEQHPSLLSRSWGILFRLRCCRNVRAVRLWTMDGTTYKGRRYRVYVLIFYHACLVCLIYVARRSTRDSQPCEASHQAVMPVTSPFSASPFIPLRIPMLSFPLLRNLIND